VKFSSPHAAIVADLRKKQRAVAVQVDRAKNDAARAAELALYGHGRAVFDRVTPYVVPTGGRGVGAIRTLYAGRSSADAFVQVRGPGQVPSGAIPQQSILRAQILGGTRRLKRLEVALQRAGVMPAGWFAIPAGAGAGRSGGGGAVRFDAYGNMSRGQVVQLIAYFQGFGAGNKRANSTERTRARLARDRRRRGPGPFVPVAGRGFIDKAREVTPGRSYFAVKERHGGLRPGIWERQQLGQGQAVRPVLFFVPGVKYTPRFDFEGVADAATRRAFAASLKRRGSFP
jgi:hypothetical protein